MTQITAEDLVSEFTERGWDCVLGRLVQKIIIVDPVRQLYADRTIDRITMSLNSGRVVTFKPKAAMTLADMTPEDIEVSFDDPGGEETP